MDQPGKSHYVLRMSQETLNGHGGYHGRGYESNGREGNVYEANGYNGSTYGDNAHNGYAEGRSGDNAQAGTDEPAHDAAMPYEGVLDFVRDGTEPADAVLS